MISSPAPVGQRQRVSTIAVLFQQLATAIPTALEHGNDDAYAELSHRLSDMQRKMVQIEQLLQEVNKKYDDILYWQETGQLAKGETPVPLPPRPPDVPGLNGNPFGVTLNTGRGGHNSPVIGLPGDAEAAERFGVTSPAIEMYRNMTEGQPSVNHPRDISPLVGGPPEELDLPF